MIEEIHDYQIDHVDEENKIIYTYYDFFNKGIFSADTKYGHYTIIPMTFLMLEETTKEINEEIFKNIGDTRLHPDFDKFLEKVESEKIYNIQELTEIYNEVTGENKTTQAFSRLKLVRISFERKTVHKAKKEWQYLYRKISNPLIIPIRKKCEKIKRKIIKK